MRKLTILLLTLFSITLFGQFQIQPLDSALSVNGITFNEADYSIKDSTDFATKIYINPEWTGVESGTISEPYKSLANVTWITNTAYLIKSGTIDTLYAPININVDNILVGTYGGNILAQIEYDTTIIPTDGTNGYKTFYNYFKISNNNITIRDLILIGRTDIFGNNCTIYNNEYKGDSLVDDMLVVWGDSTTIYHNYLHDGTFEGIYGNSNGADSGIFVDIRYNYITRINRAWYQGATQAIADGDAIQFTGYTDVFIKHNIIDRSYTGNKFCVIINNENSKQTIVHAYVDSNIMYLPKPTTEGGGGIYFGAPHQSYIRGNKIFQPNIPDTHIAAIWLSSAVDSATIFGNLIVNPYRDIQISYGEVVKWYNNTSIGYSLSAANNITLLKENNIAEGTMSGATNISLLDYTEAELFNDPTNNNYSLKENSPAIDIGTDVVGLPYSGIAPDAGYLEYGSTVEPWCSLHPITQLGIITQDTVPNNTGSIDVTKTGGVGTITYSWSSGETTEDISSKPFGIYINTITDDSSCVSIKEYTISAYYPTPISDTIILDTILLNFGSATETGYTTIGGGLQTYYLDTITITPNEVYNAIDARVVSNSDFPTNVSTSSNYLLTTDAAIQYTIANLPSNVLLDFRIYSAWDTDAIERKVIYNIDGINYDTINATGNSITTQINNIKVDTNSFIFKATEYGETNFSLLNGIKIIVKQISESETNPCDTTTINLSANITKSTGTNGAIDLTVSGGAVPYRYLWSNSQTTQDISNLTPNIYSVTVTDNNGCTGTDSYTINNTAPSVTIQYIYYKDASGDPVTIMFKGEKQTINIPN